LTAKIISAAESINGNKKATACGEKLRTKKLFTRHRHTLARALALKQKSIATHAPGLQLQRLSAYIT